MSVDGEDPYHADALRRLANGDIGSVIEHVLDPTHLLDAASLITLLPRLHLDTQVAVLNELTTQLDSAPSNLNHIDGLTTTIYSWYSHPDPRIQAAALRLTRFADPDPARVTRQLTAVADADLPELSALARREATLSGTDRHQHSLVNSVSSGLSRLIDERPHVIHIHHRAHPDHTGDV